MHNPRRDVVFNSSLKLLRGAAGGGPRTPLSLFRVGAEEASYSAALGRAAGVTGLEGFDVELALTAVVIHVPHLAKDGALFPPHVMNATDGPHAPNVPVGVVAVERKFVIEINSISKRRSWVSSPLENLLCPVHPHEAVHLALGGHLTLRSVPEWIVGVGGLKLGPRVQILALILSVKCERVLCPVRGPLDRVVLVVVEAIVVRQLAPDHQLLHKVALALGMLGGPLDQQRGTLRRQLSKVEVRRNLALCLLVWVVAFVVVDVEPLRDELLQCSVRGSAAGWKSWRFGHRPVGIQRCEGLNPVNSLWELHHARIGA
mmetsp:Transcript_35783/g.93624  ORF Transcript_35783/g.93624 Transcript_35783/m.93624 type:complete len:316 (+) Transcript_35783:82-1029(+)